MKAEKVLDWNAPSSSTPPSISHKTKITTPLLTSGATDINNPLDLETVTINLHSLVEYSTSFKDYGRKTINAQGLYIFVQS